MLLIVSLLPHPSGGKDIDGKGTGPLKAGFQPDSAGVGSVVQLRLDFELPDGARLPEKPEIGGIEKLTVLDVITGSGGLVVRILVDRLETIRTGHLSLTYVDKNGENQIFKANPLSLTVLSNLGDKPEEAQLKPIHGIIPTIPIWRKYWPWGISGLGILVVAAAIFLWLKRRSTRRYLGDACEASHIWARRELEALEARRLFEKGQVKAFYFGLSEILRQYLESLRHFPAAEFTTEEISQHIKSAQDRKLLPLLKHADLVKFSDWVPTTARKEEDFLSAISYVQETGAPLESGVSKERARGEAS